MLIPELVNEHRRLRLAIKGLKRAYSIVVAQAPVLTSLYVYSRANRSKTDSKDRDLLSNYLFNQRVRRLIGST